MQCEFKNSKQSYPMQIKSYKNTKQFRLEQNVLKLYNRAFLFIKMSAYFDSYFLQRKSYKRIISFKKYQGKC